MTKKQTIAQREEATLKQWQEAKIFEQSVAQDAPQGEYVFYDGPPFATGTPHYGHLVGTVMKDVVPRYWTMQGYRVQRRWGWDCHGLPIENIVEKELAVESKKDIEEKIGVAVFNETCRSKVLEYADVWQQVIPRIGRWVDMDQPYRTMDKDYMESVWWVFKQLWDKNLIYESYRSMHICPRCQTTLAQSEVTEGYQDITDLSVIAKFKVNPGQQIGDFVADEQTYILAWTTTPWTLPGNVALAVGEDVAYKLVTAGDEHLVVAAEAVERLPLPDDATEVATLQSSDVVGLSYQPLFPYFDTAENKERGFKVYAADFVTTEDGTGVVHIAPAFGEDDMNLGQAHNLPFIQHVGMDGRFVAAVTDFAGDFVKPKEDVQQTDVKMIKYLAAAGSLFHKEKYTHSYPHCYRCDTPLLNYATSSWFVKVTELKPRALELAQSISWVPAHIKEGRFGQWLEGARDWSISRQRYWGSVMPVWRCSGETCEEHRVFGSVAELAEASGQQIDDLHKHIVDEITVPCHCGGQMHRIPDVLDCWFESGSMPYAQQHYPFENKQQFEANFPAQFIAEGADQCRAWFYYLVVLSTALMDTVAFENVIVNGIVLAEDGKKMSKRLQNYPDPMEVVNKYGADSLRYYLLTSPVMKADTLNFSEKGVEEVMKKVLMILGNVVSFYTMFCSETPPPPAADSDHVLDRWIIARLNQLVAEVTTAMDGYDLVKASRPIGQFIDELSTWYVRRSRDRFKSDDAAEKEQVLATLRHVLLTLSQVMAPFMPFMAEHVYQTVGGQVASVHLTSWPPADTPDEAVLKDMDTVRKIVEAGLAARAEAGIKIRQPLASYSTSLVKALPADLTEIITDELHIQTLQFGVDQLDTELTPELVEQGLYREVVRLANALRKQAGLQPGQTVAFFYDTDNADILQMVEKYSQQLQQDMFATALTAGRGGVAEENSNTVTINQSELWLGIEN